MTKVAVVILNYNGRNYLEKFLPPLIQCSPDVEIIIADNASTDDSVSLLKEKFSTLRLIELGENYGFAGGYNEALKEVNAEYFVLLNSDVEVTDEWLEPIVNFLDHHQVYAVCQPKILDFNKKDHFEYAGAAGGFIDSLGYPFCRGRIFENIEKDEGQYDDEMDITWASGACLVVRSKVFKEVGGFDSDFFAHMEEIDLCWKILNHGHSIKCIPKSTVYHVGGGTLSKSSPFKTYLNFRNGLSLILKNMSIRSLIWKLPLRIFLDWVAGVRFAVSIGPRHSIAVAKSHFTVLKQLIKTLRKRDGLRIDPTKSYSIVFKYFILGKKTFRDL